jgi:rhodanese-related sulfurtransferase/rubrerythrin
MFETLKKLFTPVQSLETSEVKDYLDTHETGSYTLLDVRQPGEYEGEHIPGAKLIPLPQLADAYQTLDKEKPVLVYCAIGGRSRVAAQLLAGQGFKEIYNITGGIKAWKGGTAEGPVELNLDMVRGDETPAEIIRLAYGMEHSLGTFYRVARETTQDAEVAALLEKLAAVEEQHKRYLLDLSKTMEGKEGAAEIREAESSATAMEGGFNSDELLLNNESFLRSVPDLLDLSMMVETQALDLYVRFAEKVQDQRAKDILSRLADEEKGHLQALGRLRQEKTLK